MKLYLKIFYISAGIVSLLCACQKEDSQPVDDGLKAKTHTVKFVAGEPDTKTTVEKNETEGQYSAVFSWTDDDKSRFKIYEIVEGKDDKEAETTTGVLDNGKMSLTATFEGEEYEFESGVSYQAVFNKAVAATQTGDDSNYDQTSDVLVSEEKKLEAAAKSISLKFKREVAIAKMTLTGLSEGTTLKEVTITSDKPIAGTYDRDHKKFDDTSTSNTITINSTSAISSGDSASVFFVTIPIENATLIITAKTYTGDTEKLALAKKLTNTISFTQGDVKVFTVDMSSKGNMLFYESFDTNSKKGGNDGNWSSLGSGSLESDNENWNFVCGYGASRCARFGKSDAKGSAQTPAIDFSGDVTVKFKAGAWNATTESTHLVLESTSGTLSSTTLSMSKGIFQEYVVTVKDATNPKITISAENVNNNRFLLDEVMIYE